MPLLFLLLLPLSLKKKSCLEILVNEQHFFIGLSINTCILVSRFAQEVVKPKVSQMDETEKLDPAVLNELFQQGVKYIIDRINTITKHVYVYSWWVSKLMPNTMVPTVLSPLLSSPSKVNNIDYLCEQVYSTIVLELAKVDPAVSVICDVQVWVIKLVGCMW